MKDQLQAKADTGGNKTDNIKYQRQMLITVLATIPAILIICF